MEFVHSVESLEALYGQPSVASLRKVATRLTPAYRRWILASRFCVLTTVGPSGTDGSPRGDDGPVVAVLDEATLAMPDWRGNNRMDSLRNIVEDGRVSVMFMVPGSTIVVRVNGTARVTLDEALCTRFATDGKTPRSVIVIAIAEVYSQCARALLRARIWGDTPAPDDLPTAGDIMDEVTRGEIDGATYDADWSGRAAQTLW